MDLMKQLKVDDFPLFINQKSWFYDYNIRSGFNLVNLDRIIHGIDLYILGVDASD